MNHLLNYQPNFRDLGGIRTTDGMLVREGMLFRSGDLSRLDDGDIASLESMKLACIIDFRAKREIEKHPNRVTRTVRRMFHLEIHDAARDRAEQLLADNDAEAIENVLVGDYARMVREHSAVFRRFLEIVAGTEDLPLVYHCAAGKDRTGLATVFLLEALGAGMEEIISDYMATNSHVEKTMEFFISKLTEEGMNGELLRPLLTVRPEYLNSALAEIKRMSGSLERYVADVLKADARKLREKYLISAS